MRRRCGAHAEACGGHTDFTPAAGQALSGDRRVVELCAYWHPAGLWGLLYWYAHLPLYSPLVNSAVAEVARRAEALDDKRATTAEPVT